jgi:hypothetical protein
VSALIAGDAVQLAEWLNIGDALFVAAERIPRVSDGNRGGHDRVDFFAYMPSGEVFRFHPGRNTKEDAHPHRMRLDSLLFKFQTAAASGVGSALHAVPPGFVPYAGAPQPGVPYAGAPQPGVFAVTAAMLNEPSRHDVQCCSGKKLFRALAIHHQPGCEVDIAGGDVFPWWLALKSSVAGQDAIGGGIFRVLLSTHEGKPALLLENSQGRVRLTLTYRMEAEQL